MDVALQAIQKWGLEYVTTLAVWDKQHGGMSTRVPGRYTTSSCEFLLLARCGKGAPLLSTTGIGQPAQMIREQVRAHSQKPDSVFSLVESLFDVPYGERLELFARARRQGWYQHGDQLGIQLDAYHPRDPSPTQKKREGGGVRPMTQGEKQKNRCSYDESLRVDNNRDVYPSTVVHRNPFFAGPVGATTEHVSLDSGWKTYIMDFMDTASSLQRGYGHSEFPKTWRYEDLEKMSSQQQRALTQPLADTYHIPVAIKYWSNPGDGVTRQWKKKQWKWQDTTALELLLSCWYQQTGHSDRVRLLGMKTICLSSQTPSGYDDDCFYDLDKWKRLSNTIQEVLPPSIVELFKTSDQAEFMRSLDGYLRSLDNKHLEFLSKCQFGMAQLCRGERLHIRGSNSEDLSMSLVFMAHQTLAHGGHGSCVSLLNDNGWHLDETATQSTKRMISQCLLCSRRFGHPVKTPFRQGHMDVPTKPGVAWSLDFVGPRIKTPRGNKYIVTMIDLFSHWGEVMAVPADSAADVVYAIHERIIPTHGYPEVIVTDRGSHFRNALMKTFVEKYDIRHVFTTAYHPQANGIIERMHLDLKNAIYRCLD
jgi:hypothetical protein